jgi:hypothetical protein
MVVYYGSVKSYSGEDIDRSSIHTSRRKHTQTPDFNNNSGFSSFKVLIIGLLLGIAIGSFARPLAVGDGWNDLGASSRPDEEEGPLTLDFDEKSATLQLQFSNVAYCGHENYLRGFSSLKNDTRFNTFRVTSELYSKSTDTQGFVGFFDGDDPTSDIQVAFRGSSSPTNYVGDLIVWKEKNSLPNCEGCSIHAGFDSAFQSIREELLSAVEDAASMTSKKANRKPRVRLTGHSLGGALAVLAAWDIANDPTISNLISSIDVITFGEPVS